MRIFRFQKAPERVEVKPGSGAYERLNPTKNLKNFKVISSEVCVTTFRLEDAIRDPIELAFPVKFLRQWIMRDTGVERIKRVGPERKRKKYLQRGRLLQTQYCSAAHGPFRLTKSLPGKEERLVRARSLVHLIAHLALIHASVYAADTGQPPKLEEVTFYNEHNKREIIVVYNWPLQADRVGGFLRNARDYIESCIAGRPDRNFLRHMEEQRLLYENSRDWDKSIS